MCSEIGFTGRWSIVFFVFNDTATTEIYTLSLHDALPISGLGDDAGLLRELRPDRRPERRRAALVAARERRGRRRSEEHTSELQSRQYLVCRLLLEKKTSTPASAR